MNKQEVIKEILEVHKREQFIAGHIYRRYPVHRERKQPGDDPVNNLDLDIIYTLVNHTTNLEILTKRTFINVKKLEMLYNIDWFYIMRYRTESEGYTKRHAVIVYGIINDHLVTFFRKETYSSFAGQTHIYFGNGNKIQCYKLIKPDWFHNDSNLKIQTKDVTKFIRSIKLFYRITRNVELEKLVLMFA